AGAATAGGIRAGRRTQSARRGFPAEAPARGPPEARTRLLRTRAGSLRARRGLARPLRARHELRPLVLERRTTRRGDVDLAPPRRPAGVLGARGTGRSQGLDPGALGGRHGAGLRAPRERALPARVPRERR